MARCRRPRAPDSAFGSRAERAIRPAAAGPAAAQSAEGGTGTSATSKTSKASAFPSPTSGPKNQRGQASQQRSTLGRSGGAVPHRTALWLQRTSAPRGQAPPPMLHDARGIAIPSLCCRWYRVAVREVRRRALPNVTCRAALQPLLCPVTSPLTHSVSGIKKKKKSIAKAGDGALFSGVWTGDEQSPPPS